MCQLKICYKISKVCCPQIAFLLTLMSFLIKKVIF